MTPGRRAADLARGAVLAAALTLPGACGDRMEPAPPELGAADLVLPAFDSLRITLAEGRGERRDASGVLLAEAGLTDWRATGDFDADGVTDAVAVVWSSGGGSGTFMELALFALEPGDGSRPGAWRWVASMPLGDRVRVRALTVDGPRVEVHLTRHRSDDPMCCPTEDAVLAFRADRGGLAADGGP